MSGLLNVILILAIVVTIAVAAPPTILRVRHIPVRLVDVRSNSPEKVYFAKEVKPETSELSRQEKSVDVSAIDLKTVELHHAARFEETTNDVNEEEIAQQTSVSESESEQETTTEDEPTTENVLENVVETESEPKEKTELTGAVEDEIESPAESEPETEEESEILNIEPANINNVEEHEAEPLGNLQEVHEKLNAIMAELAAIREEIALLRKNAPQLIDLTV